jgi:hypothetical protein
MLILLVFLRYFLLVTFLDSNMDFFSPSMYPEKSERGGCVRRI